MCREAYNLAVCLSEAVETVAEALLKRMSAQPCLLVRLSSDMTQPRNVYSVNVCGLHE